MQNSKQSVARESKGSLILASSMKIQIKAIRGPNGTGFFFLGGGMEIVVVNTYFEKEGEQRVTKGSVARCTKVGYILYRI